jgi:hypothetical protein
MVSIPKGNFLTVPHGGCVTQIVRLIAVSIDGWS